MVDKEKIRAEIERLKGNPYYMMAIKDVLAIIDSPPEEPFDEVPAKEPIDYDKLNIMLEESLAKETTESWNERLDKDKPEWIKELETKLQSVSRDEFQKIMQKYEEECDLKEEPISEDLNTELDKYIKDKFTIDKEQLDRFGLEEKDYMYSMDKTDMLKMASYFANFGKKQAEIEIQAQSIAVTHGCPKEEPVSDDLEAFVNSTYPDRKVVLGRGNTCLSCGRVQREACITGANWQKKKDYQDESDMAVVAYMDGVEKGKKMMRDQIMKDAVDGTVFAKLENGEIMVLSNYFMPEDLSCQDKVKLIISKEE